MIFRIFTKMFLLLLLVSSAFAQPGFEVIHRSPEEFPELPSAMVSVLKEKGLFIPQTGSELPGNVAEGNLGKGPEKDWVVLCSKKDGYSFIMVFWDGKASDAFELGLSPNKKFILENEDGNGTRTYSFTRTITVEPVDALQDSLKQMPESGWPTVIHDAVSDLSEAAKSQVLYYFHENKWLQSKPRWC